MNELQNLFACVHIVWKSLRCHGLSSVCCVSLVADNVTMNFHEPGHILYVSASDGMAYCLFSFRYIICNM